MCPKTLGLHASYQKKLSKKLLKGANLVLQKGTKKIKLSLGSWLAIWAANEICNFLAEFKSLKNEKGNYLMSKLRIYDLATCIKGNSYT